MLLSELLSGTTRFNVEGGACELGAGLLTLGSATSSPVEKVGRTDTVDPEPNPEQA